MIEKLRVSYLLSAELAEITSNYIQSFENSLLTEPYLVNVTELLRNDLTQLNSSLTAVRTNRLVENVAQADGLRDNAFLAFKDLVDIGRRRTNETVLAAYERVWPLLESAGLIIYRYGYAEKSGRIDALIEQLSTTEMETYIAALNATELYNELQEAQTNFSNLYQERLLLENDRRRPTQQEAVSQLVPHINAFLTGIDIQFEISPDTYQSLIDQINVITTEIMSVARARRSRVETRAVLRDSEGNTPATVTDPLLDTGLNGDLTASDDAIVLAS